MRKRAPFLVALVVTALAGPAATAVAIPPPIGGLTPIPGACITESAVPGCTTDPGAGDVNGLAVRPGGTVLYVLQGSSAADNSQGALLAYSRDPQTGAIGARISCRAYGTAGLPGCVGDPALYSPHGLALAPDGTGLYVTSQPDFRGALIAYATDPQTGAIGNPTSCFLEAGNAGCGPVPVQRAYGLDYVKGVAVSPDGKAVYTVASAPHGGVAAFARLSTDGSLTAELRCASGAASPTGDAGPGKCDLPVDTAVNSGSAIAATNKAVYVSSDQGTDANGDVVAYARDAAAGTLTGRLNCFSETSFPGCAGRFGLVAPFALAVSPDGKDLYAAGLDTTLNGTRGQLTTIRIAGNASLSLVEGCLGTVAADTCTTAKGIRNVTSIAPSGDGGQLYAADTADGNAGSVTAFGLSQALPATPALSCLAGVAIGGCSTAATVHYPGAIAVSPNGRFVYSGSHSGTTGLGAIQAYSRELAPSCSASSASTSAGVAVSVPLACTDPNGDSLTLSIVGGKPAHGVLGTIDQAARTTLYTPADGFVGHDSFMYTASDGRAGTTAASAGIDVAAAPDPSPGPGPDPSPGPGPGPGPGPDPSPGPTAATCKVPKLVGLRLTRAKKKLAKAHCKLGKVRRPKHRRNGLVVVQQSPKSGVATKKRVAVRLGKLRRVAK
jgi:6-phosphogluconolactonase (cycloisomerase 2 family)